MTAGDKARKAATVLVSLSAVWKAAGGEVQRNPETGKIDRVTALGFDWFNRERMNARRARRRAKKE